MNSLDVAQKIKIIKEARLTIPVYRAPTEDYDVDHPTRFDRHVVREDIQINSVIIALMGTIRYLSKELVLSNTVHSKEVWSRLSDVKKMLESQVHTQSSQMNRR